MRWIRPRQFSRSTRGTEQNRRRVGATKSSAATLTMTAGVPTSAPGSSAANERISGMSSAVSALDARICTTICACARATRSRATEIATNNRPTSAPDAPASAVKKSWSDSGTMSPVCPRLSAARQPLRSRIPRRIAAWPACCRSSLITLKRRTARVTGGVNLSSTMSSKFESLSSPT
jgi:hypothetical protein